MRFINPQGFANGEDFFVYLRDSFDVLYSEGERAPKMMSIGLHCRLAGRPGRAAGLMRFLDYVAGFDRVWIATAARHRAALASRASPRRRRCIVARSLKSLAWLPFHSTPSTAADRKAFAADARRSDGAGAVGGGRSVRGAAVRELAALYQAMTEAVRKAPARRVSAR